MTQKEIKSRSSICAEFTVQQYTLGAAVHVTCNRPSWPYPSSAKEATEISYRPVPQTRNARTAQRWYTRRDAFSKLGLFGQNGTLAYAGSFADAKEVQRMTPIEKLFSPHLNKNQIGHKKEERLSDEGPIPRSSGSQTPSPPRLCHSSGIR